MQAIHDTVQTIARKIFQKPDLVLTDATTAADVEKWDSMNHIFFIMEVEKAFGVKFKNGEIARLQCVGDLKRLAAKHRPDLAKAA
jgi:acyl carrier protein